MKNIFNIIVFSSALSFNLFAEGVEGYSLAKFTEQTAPKKDEPNENTYSKWYDCMIKSANASAGFDTYRGVPDGSWSGNSGFVFAADFLAGLEREQAKFGIQAGGSYGIYDWEGRGFTLATSQEDLQMDGFITGALFASAPQDNGFMINVAYDLFVASYYGVFGLGVLVDQFRGNLGYTFNGHDRLGAWITYFIQTDSKEFSQIPVRYRAVPQVNVYWTHFFKNDSHLTLWGGTPYGDSLMYTSGRPGIYTIGMDLTAVLDEHWSLSAYGSYMGAHDGQVFNKSSNYGNNVGFLLTYNVYGLIDKAAAVMANHSNFLVDTNVNQ